MQATIIQTPDRRLQLAHAELMRVLAHNQPPRLDCRSAPIGAQDYVALQDYVRKIDVAMVKWASALGEMASENAYEVNADDLANGLSDPFDLLMSQLESAAEAYRNGEYFNQAAE